MILMEYLNIRTAENLEVGKQAFQLLCGCGCSFVAIFDNVRNCDLCGYNCGRRQLLKAMGGSKILKA